MDASNDSIWLSEADVAKLTGKKRWSAQCKALAGMGVPFRPSAIGQPLVEVAAVASVTKAKPAGKTAAPNWDAIKKVA